MTTSTTTAYLDEWELRPNDSSGEICVSGWENDLPCLHRTISKRADGTFGRCGSFWRSPNYPEIPTGPGFDLVEGLWSYEQMRVRDGQARTVYFCELCMIQRIK